jgi:hypothetical protein
MNEGQIWFLLVFSIPFLPAFIVFRMLPAGDLRGTARGKLPFLGRLDIRMQGAVVAYVIVCLIALGAYVVITRTETINITLVVDGDAQAPGTRESKEWLKRAAAEIKVQLRFAGREVWLADFFHLVIDSDPGIH